MPATNPRITTVVDPDLESWLRQRSENEGRSLSVLVRNVLEKFRRDEDERYWSRAGEERLATFDRDTALSHDEAWE